MPNLRSSNVAGDRLLYTVSPFRLTPRRWRLFGDRRYSGRAAADAVRDATELGRADGQNPGFDKYTERPQPPRRTFVADVTKPTQESLGQDAADVRERALAPVSDARANANTGTVKHRWILLVVMLVALFEYVVGVHVANLVYRGREEESRLVAVALAVISSLLAWAIATSVRVQVLEQTKRRASLILGGLIVVFIVSLGTVLATKGVASVSGPPRVLGGEYGQGAVSDKGGVTALLSLARYLVYPVTLGMGAGLIFLLEIIARQHDALGQRIEGVKSYRLALRLEKRMTKAAARIIGIVQLSKTVQEAGLQVLRGYDAGLSETLSPSLKDILTLDDPEQIVVAPTWRPEMEKAAEELQKAAAKLRETPFPSEATAPTSATPV